MNAAHGNMASPDLPVHQTVGWHAAAAGRIVSGSNGVGESSLPSVARTRLEQRQSNDISILVIAAGVKDCHHFLIYPFHNGDGFEPRPFSLCPAKIYLHLPCSYAIMLRYSFTIMPINSLAYSPNCNYYEIFRIKIDYSDFGLSFKNCMPALKG